jgi:hypothetical protein
VVLSISSLLLDDSPRHDGENDEHVHVLTESEEQLPPIVVHGPSRRVIDGRHRVRAAVMRGDDKIMPNQLSAHDISTCSPARNFLNDSTSRGAL